MNDPILCRDCVFWSRHTMLVNYKPQRWGDCSNDHFVGTYAYAPVEKPGSVIVEIDEGWGFYTDEAFGCIHAQPRPESVNL